MNPGEQASASYWQGLTFPSIPSIATNERADVCIVGAGIAGLTTAYMLLQEGFDVVVLEKGEEIGGETLRTTAHLASALDDGFMILQQNHGIVGARLAAQSHGAAIDLIEQIIQTEGIDCQFQRLPGYLFLGPNHDEPYLLQEQYAAVSAGLQVDLLEQTPLPYPSPQDQGFGPCLKFHNQAQFHPAKYLRGLALSVMRLGGRIFTSTSAISVQAGDLAKVETQQGASVLADSVVVATNVPVNNVVSTHMKQSAYRSYVVAMEMPIPPEEPALYWDTASPYHYLRFSTSKESGKTYLIVGGEDHRTGQGEDPHDPYLALESWTRERIPNAGAVKYKWSGQIIEPVDGLAFIGHNPHDGENIYIITGDSGHGMTHGTIGGLIVKDLILKQENPWSKLYDPQRLLLRSAGKLLKENSIAMYQYKDWFNADDDVEIEDIPRGTGVIIRHGLLKAAVYRDVDGSLYPLSAVCTHLGGIVRWNKAERTWDCPCHGSRFDFQGEVINGPAIASLAKVSLSELIPSAEKRSLSSSLPVEPLLSPSSSQ